MKEVKCDNSQRVISEGIIYYQIMPVHRGNSILPEEQERINRAYPILADLDFATPKDVAQYIMAHPEIQNL